MDAISILGDLAHLVITVPVLAVGIVVGALGYRYLLKKDPTLLSSLVSAAYTDLQKLEAEVQSKLSTAVVPVPTAPVPAATAPVPVTTSVAPVVPPAQ